MEERVRQIMTEVFGQAVGPQPSQANTENWDSLRHLNLVIALEMEFDISFEPEEIAHMKDLNSILALINQKKA